MKEQKRVSLILALVLALAAVGSTSAASPPAGAAVPALVSVPPSTQGIKGFDNLPLGLAPAIARTLADDLPASYRLQATEGGYRADNAAHDLATTFGSTGPLMTIAGETWGLTLTGLGRGSALEALPAAELAANGPRIEYRYPGLIEWYLNTHWGLEQGFSLETPPAGYGDLVLELTMSGSLRASLQDDTTLQLTDAQGYSIARYTGLLAYDASGRQLPARLRLGGTLVSIVVDDAGAAYPITIDPWVQHGKLVASDRANDDEFGYSVAISGDTVVVGAHLDDDNGDASGSAYVFQKPPSGWSGASTQTAKLLPDDGYTSDDFGRSVAISGDTVVVGAHLEDPNDIKNAGSVYVFEKGSAWLNGSGNQKAKLVPDDGVEGDHFGVNVAISGDTVVAGVPINDDIGENAGKAYVFVKPGGGWSGTLNQTAKLLPDGGVADDYFGQSVSISGDTVVIGASRADANGEDSGSAFVFEKGSGWADGSANQTAKLLPNDGAAGDLFGRSVAVSGDTVLVGAYHDSVNGNNSGSAYVFVEPGGGWSGTLNQTAKLLPDDGVAGDQFGNPVSISGHTAAIGALGHPKGSAYVFEKGSAWVDGSANQTAKLLASDGATGDNFGIAAISEDTVVLGAPFDDGKGSAYVFGLAPELVGIYPPRNAISATLDTNITARYDEDMDPASVTHLTFAIHGMQSGLVTETHGVISGNTLIVTPRHSFHQGELVYAIATTGTASLEGVAPATATQWQFNAGVVSNRCVSGFTEVYSGSLTGVYGGSVAWGDYDNDDDLDILLTGQSGDPIAKVYQNTGSGFGEVYAGSLEGVWYSSAAWGDYDNDGDLDILLTGQDSGGGYIAKVYQNTGSGFSEVFAGSLEGVEFSSVAWGDYDNDGDLDILLTGWGSGNRTAKVYQNKSSLFSEVYAGSLMPVARGSVAWGDYDNDGDLDILLTGHGNSGYTASVYQNTGSGFSEVYAGSLVGVSDSSVAWGDYDNDGDLDILLTGRESGSGLNAKVYQNTGSGFGEVYAGSLEVVRFGSVAWGDYDNDGDLDILLTGSGSDDVSSIAKIYQNTGSGFNEVHAGSLPGVRQSSVAWGDYDNDGDLDILLTGFDDNSSSSIAKVYRNDGCVSDVSYVYLPIVLKSH